jgi:hypothetical protein
MTHHPVLEPSVVTAIEDYFRLLQAHASAEEMLAEVVTEDFRSGFVGGHMWDGPEGLADFLSARSVFFDESHELLQILEVGRQDDGRVLARTRLRFFLRRRDAGAARSEEYTGDAFHTWMFEPDRGRSRWRVRTAGGRLRRPQRPGATAVLDARDRPEDMTVELGQPFPRALCLTAH